MPAGIKRSKWTPLLSRSLGFSTLQRLRDILNEGGIKAPYEDDKLEAALKLLREKGHNTSKFESQWAARAAATAQTAAVGSAAKKKSKSKHPVSMSESRQKAAATRRQGTGEKLLYRLAELLPSGPTNYGRTQARMILESGGVYEKQNTDEAKALAVFQARGIPITHFRRAASSTSNGNSQPVMVLPEPVTVSVAPTKPRIPKIIEMGLQQIEQSIIKEAEQRKRRHVSKAESQALYLNACIRDGDFD